MKAVTALSNDIVISAARDKTVRSWNRTSANTFSPDKVYLGHGHFVNALTTIKPNEAHGDGNTDKDSTFYSIFLTQIYYRTYCIRWF